MIRNSLLRLPRYAGLAIAALQLLGQQPDLPFDSGSTGADGALAFPDAPRGFASGPIAYDPIRQESLFHDAGETWALKDGAWRRLRPPVAPASRFYASMAWDPVRQEMVLFGGSTPQGNSLNETWTWNGTNWTLRAPATIPPARYRAGIAFDESRGVMVLFGGIGAGLLRDTWEWDGANWSKFTGSDPSTDWENGGVCYDAARHEVLLATGSGGTVELWAYQGTSWLKKSPAVKPTLPKPRVGRSGGHRMSGRTLAYDAARQQVVLYGGAYADDSTWHYNRPIEDMWLWDGTNWAPATAPQLPPGRWWGVMTFDAALNEVVLFSGYELGVALGDTWTWNGSRWRLLVEGRFAEIDMAAKPNGIWNYTTIDIPAEMTIRFKRNAANTPVRWLATGPVTVNGRLDLNGQTFGNQRLGDVIAPGGPGGFDGGGGGVRFQSSGSFDGKPGQGPAGGAPGIGRSAQSGNGNHAESYGNMFLQPLIGGSGGGGSGSSDTEDGVPGSGGGGAILISSSRDIVLNGSIQANGGFLERCCGNLGGSGAGGAVLLRADRILGAGRIEAVRNLQPSGNPGTEFARDGRIRLEAYRRDLSPANLLGSVTQANPSANGELNLGAGELRIVSIAGQPVPQPPTGSLATTDVVFSQTGPIDVVLSAPGATDNTRVRIRVAHANGVLVSDPALTAGGNASVTVTVPRGVGTVQAFTEVAP